MIGTYKPVAKYHSPNRINSRKWLSFLFSRLQVQRVGLKGLENPVTANCQYSPQVTEEFLSAFPFTPLAFLFACS